MNPKYTKYEKARVIGARALQLAMGAPLILKLSPKDLKKIKFNPVTIAKRELLEGLLPLNIKRPLPYRH
ncbi:DNA-directed RNA polymerase subunit K [archaeon]|nr:DNA-directed RNA polymerase subunit K [archaeon]|tara:strand:- start:568 stop:774 length:207 start_codon:yes stop_codon:yes gene_type:complete